MNDEEERQRFVRLMGTHSGDAVIPVEQARTRIGFACESLLAEIDAAPPERIRTTEKAAARAAVITLRERLLEPGALR